MKESDNMDREEIRPMGGGLRLGLGLGLGLRFGLGLK